MIARNVARFYAIYFAVTVGSIFILLGGFEGLAMSGMGGRLVPIVAFLAPASMFSAIAALAIRGRPTRGARALVGVGAAAATYAAVAALLVLIVRTVEDYSFFLSPLHFLNLTAIVAGLLFGALAEARPASASSKQG